MSADRPIACPILVGRAPIVEALQRWLGRVRADEAAPRVALLAGEAGIGKSRLAALARGWAADHGFSALQGSCFEPDQVLPYGPVLDLLRTWLAGQPAPSAAERLQPYARELIKLLPELSAWLPGAALSPALEPEQEKRRHFQTLALLLTQLAPTGPALIVIEDAHWCDDTSLEFLLFLARRLAALPARGALLLTYRSDETGPVFRHFLAELDRARLALEFSLERLRPADVEAMIRAIFEQAQPVQAEFVQAIHTLTDGNPFFVEETLKSLVAAGDIYYERDTWTRKPLGALLMGNRLPRTVQDAVQRRMAALSEPARQVLTLAAVAGRRFDFTLLRQLTGRDEAGLLTLVKELLAAQLVMEESAERFAFRHALTRETVYSQLLERERQALHGQIARALEQSEATGSHDARLADLAYQFHAAGDWPKAFLYSQQAAQQALAAYAPRAAAEHAARALHAAQQAALPSPPGLYRLQGQAHELLGDFDAARLAYTQALDAAGAVSDPALEWQSLLDLGFLWTGRDYVQARDYLERALALARQRHDAAALAHSLNRVGNWYTNSDQPSEGLALHQEALHLFQDLDDPRGLGETLDLLGTAYYFGGDIFQGAEAYAKAVMVFRRLDDRQGLASSLVMLGTRGANYLHDALAWPPTNLEAAQREGEEALRLAREIGSRSNEAFASIYLAYSLGPQGEYGRALAHARAGLEIADDMDHRQWRLAAHMALGLLHLDLLALPEALAHLEEAVAIAERVGSSFTIRATTGCLVRAYVVGGKLEAAEALLAKVAGSGMPMQTQAERLLHAARADLLLAQDQWVAALLAVDQLLAATKPAPSGPALIPRLLAARGQALAGLGRAAEAEQAWLLAAHAAPRNLLWRLHVSLGKLEQQLGQPNEAERNFATARELLAALAESVPDRELRANFLEQALAKVPAVRAPAASRGVRKVAGGLTRREREVALMVTAGKTNREIAAALFIGERTVEGHVANILSKLGFSSRAQIAAWSVRQGWLTDHPPAA